MTARDEFGPDIAAFPGVDQAADPAALIAWMDDARTLPGLRIAKSRAVQALGLRPGHVVADIGCGPGEDTREMARRVAPGGRVIGVDTSTVMLAEARRRSTGLEPAVTFTTGDARELPLPDAAVDRCRADTLLQHLPDPDSAVAEMTRITRPGGRISLLEFDLGTLALDHPDPMLTRQVLDAARADAADGWAGRGLRRRLATAGCVDVTVEAGWVESDAPFLTRLLTPTLARLAASGSAPPDALDHWRAQLAAAAERGHFTGGAVVFVAAARRR
jgi:SAM-dependent methyltransferase